MQVYEIFNSIDGEVNGIAQGLPTTFIRLAGCNLDCWYCDTPESLDIQAGKRMSITEIIEAVEFVGCPNILITGGEPLFDINNFEMLVYALKEKGFSIQVETNGTIAIPSNLIDKVDCWKVDVKLSYWEELSTSRSLFDYRLLREQDWIKIPVWDKETIHLAFSFINKTRTKARIAVSPIKHLDLLLSYIRRNQKWNVVVNLQTHKCYNLK